MTDTQNPSLLKRFIGLILVFTSLGGLILSSWSIGWIWRVRAPFAERLHEDVTLVQDTLLTTRDALEVSSESLARLGRSLSSIEDSLATLGSSVEDLEPLIVTLRTFADRDIPDTITSTQTSLEVAQLSAKIIDDVLTALTAIPFFPGEPYAPEQPLHIALASVSDNLDNIPESLGRMADDLERTESNLVALRVQLRLVIATVEGLQSDVQEAQRIINSYGSTLDELIDRVDNVDMNLERWLDNTARVATVLLVWIVLTQIGLLVNGLNYLGVYL